MRILPITTAPAHKAGDAKVRGKQQTHKAKNRRWGHHGWCLRSSKIPRPGRHLRDNIYKYSQPLKSFDTTLKHSHGRLAPPEKEQQGQASLASSKHLP